MGFGRLTRYLIPAVFVCSLTAYSLLDKEENISGDSNITSMHYSREPVKADNVISDTKKRDDELRAAHLDAMVRSQKDFEYLVDNFYAKYGAVTFNKKFDNNIESLLSEVSHDHRDSVLVETDDMDSNWAYEQKMRIFVMLDNLQDSLFRNKIGHMIQKDVKDKYAEHGGAMLFDNDENLRLKNIPSEAKRTLENNGLYMIDDSKIDYPILSIFHFHAEDFDEKEYAGPSFNDIILPNFNQNMIGEGHEFVITSICKGKFNIDYVFGNYADKHLNVLDLGTYDYTPK